MPHVRKAAVAGVFYPDNPIILQQDIERFLALSPITMSTPKALIVPHAGYIYSGSVAASAYAQLATARKTIHRVVLLGPAHRVGFRGLATSSAAFFSTPLGDIPVDQAAMEALLMLPQVHIIDAAHEQEHSLEVQLPFLQTVLNDFSLIPLVVGDAQAAEVVEVIETLWGNEETLLLISSDLSHFHDYETAQRMDRLTSFAIEQLNPQAIDHEQACGHNPVNGLLLAAQHHHLSVRTLDLRNSGDTAGDKNRVVGYGAYAFNANG